MTNENTESLLGNLLLHRVLVRKLAFISLVAHCNFNFVCNVGIINLRHGFGN